MRGGNNRLSRLGKHAVVAVVAISLLSLQSLAETNLTGGKIDRIDVVYAVDGYFTDAVGNQKYFIFGAVKLHKRDAPEDEWTSPIFYFEFDNKSTLALDARYEYFTQPRSDGTLEILPILKGIQASASNYDYARYDQEEYAEHGLVEGSTPHDFEINFAFTRNGDIDVGESSIGIVPKEYRTGRKVKRFAWFGEYYKKGSKTERFQPKKDAEGKIVNLDEAGEPLYEEGLVDVSEVCYEYVVSSAIPTTPTIVEENKTTLSEEEKKSNTSASDIPPPPSTPSAPEINQTTIDEKEKTLTPEGTPAYYETTGLCSFYKVHSISRSAGLPNAHALGLIKTELKK